MQHKNIKEKTKDGLYLWSINCRDMSRNDDGSLGNEKRASNKTTKEKRKGAASVQELHNLQEIARPSNEKLCL